ncbi:MAG: Hpt domain-containing protein [Rickettsiales bacterium]
MTDLLDMIAIAEVKAMMKAKFPTMVEYFLEDSESYITSIREGIAASNAEKIVSPAHTLKSSAQQMGAIRVSEIAKEMEVLAREQSSSGNNDMQAFAAMLSKLETAFAETKEAFKQHIA